MTEPAALTEPAGMTGPAARTEPARGGGPAPAHGPVRIAVVGGGITGLAAAVRLRELAPPGSTITVYERSAALGGKLRTGELAGSTVERGAEAFLVADPAGGESAALALARRVGLADDLVHPATARAALSLAGRLVPIPGGTLVGVPGDLAQVATVARPVAERDHDAGRPLLGPDEDPSVGALVRRRLGDEVVDRLVDPMLGGVYAGRADELSLATTMPGLARAARTAHTLTGAVGAALAANPRPAGRPVFATVAGGLSRLVDAAARAAAAEVRLGATVRELARTPQGWRLVLGSTRDPEPVLADAVVLALPARPAARLLAGVDARAAALVGVLDYASVALVTLALPGAAGLPGLADLSGFLVPAAEGALIKAATFFTTKWPHLRRADGTALVRASVGRYGEEHLLQRDDADLVEIVHRELAGILGAARPAAGGAGAAALPAGRVAGGSGRVAGAPALPAPIASGVQRWGGALPQYAPGHLDRVAAARAALRAAQPSLALAGAGYDGIGIPVCVRSGEAAAEQVLGGLESLRT